MEADSSDVIILDPSDKYRPEKSEELFRNYTQDSAYYGRVKKTYQEMHTNQTYEFAKNRLNLWSKFNHGEKTMMEALDMLNHLVDESDPDCDVPNSVHAFQTAERIRAAHPDKEWFHLIGLIHDIGKVMAVWGEPQYAVVGDTFPVGCSPAESIVFGPENFKDNSDFTDPRYNTKLGVYSENCGLDKVIMSWGHDEYLYRVLKNHPACTLPEEALYMIRFHSFYPWHTGGDYMFLCSNKDMENLPFVSEFNQFDLYSKADDAPDAESLAPYYQSLIDKYIPGKLCW